MTPAELAALDPLGIGPSRRGVARTSSSYPTPNDPGRDGHNIMGYRFAAPFKNTFNTTIGRADYHVKRPAAFSAALTSRTTGRQRRRSTPAGPPRNTAQR